MAITRVELNTDRLRYRRDNRRLRASNREARYLDGDTLANSAADTPTTSITRQIPVAASDEAPSAPSSDEADTQARTNPLAKDALQRVTGETRLCDFKAVFSGAAVAPDSVAPDSIAPDSVAPAPETGSISADPTLQVGEAPPEQLAAATEQAQLPLTTAPEPEALDPSAGQSRLDLITGEWTWFATMRSQRPDQFSNVIVEPSSDIDCPFCTGQEHRTPDSVWIARIDDAGDHLPAPAGNHDRPQHPSDWAVRVVPNLYPAVTRLEDAGARTPANQQASEQAAAQEAMPASARWHRSGGTFTSHPTAAPDHRVRRASQSNARLGALFPCEPATGGHEVIIEAPRHTESFGDLNTAEISLVFAAYAERVRYWRNVPGVKHVAIFKNVGRDAGASLQHSHSQLIATNRVPAVVQQVTRRLQAHHARVGSCLQCDLLRGELEQKTRIVSQTDSFVAYCPFASRFPMQVRLTSKEHLPCFSELRKHPLNELARLALRVVRWLEILRPSTAYNVLLHTCPVDFAGATESQHWAMDIFPRVSRLAGFELATGAMINPIYPETAAKAYRAQARLSDPRYVLR